MSAIPKEAASSVPVERPKSGILSDINTRILLIAAALYVLVYLVFYPPVFAIMDEAAYFNTAYAFRHGTFYLEQVGAPPIIGYHVGEHAVSQYPPGMPALISLVSLFGWQTAMATNLLVHLATVAVIAAVLRRIGVPSAFAVLYLFFPTAVIYSRTVMSDLASGLLITLAFWGCLANRYWAAGICLGAAVCVRTPNGIFLVLLGLATLLESRQNPQEPWDWRRRILSVIQMGLGAIPLTAAAYAYQAVVQEGGWGKYLGSYFSLSHFPAQFLFYSLTLSVLYPLMFLAPAFYSGPGKVALRLLTYSMIGLYSFYYFHDSTGSFLESTVIGLRFILVILPLFLIAYSQWLWNLYQRVVIPRIPVRVSTLAAGAAAFVLLAGAAAIHYRHQNYLKQAAHVRDGILQVVKTNDILFCNMDIAKILLPSFGRRRVYLTASVDTAAGMQRAKARINEGLSDGTGRVIVADWSRGEASKTAEEQKDATQLEQDYEIRPLPVEARAGLPPEVQMVQIVGRRSANR